MCLLRLTERGPWKESDIVLLAIIDNEVRFSISEAVTVLHRDDRHDPASPLYVFASHIRERNMTNLSLLAQSSQRLYRRLEGDSIIGSMELIHVDTVQTQALQTPIECFGEMFRAGIMRPLAGAGAFPSTFGRDH